MFLCGCGGEVGDVFEPVFAGGEEVRHDDDGFGALGDAFIEGGGDGGLCELHVGGFDDGPGILGFILTGEGAVEVGDVNEQVVGFCPA